MMKITIEVPDYIDMRILQVEINYAIEHAKFIHEEKITKKSILESDKKLAEMKIGNPPIPITRASSYDNNILRSQEIPGWGFTSDDPRRPVLLRGSYVALMTGDYPSIDDYAYKVVERYLRSIKYTCSNVEENRVNLNNLEYRIKDKIPYRFTRSFSLTHYVRSSYNGVKLWVGTENGKSSFWLNGEYFCTLGPMPERAKINQISEVFRKAENNLKATTRLISRIQRKVNEDDKHSGKHHGTAKEDASSVGEIREGGNLRDRGSSPNRVRTYRNRLVKS
jgi:hypothetical protein